MFDFDFDAIKKAASSVFDYLAAYHYNEERDFSRKAIKIIRTAVGSSSVEWWDAEAVFAIQKWQADPKRLKPLDSDGKLGPKSIGVMIAELEKKGDTMSAAILKAYPYKDVKTGQIRKVDIVQEVSFSQFPKRPLVLKQEPTGEWAFQGSFKVIVNVHPDIVEPWRYEYRQYIRGHVIMNRPSGEESAGNHFQVPGGLDPLIFKEDGQVMAKDGSYERFGYRNRRPTYEVGLMDYYSNNQMGPQYNLEDTYGPKAGRAAEFHKIKMHIVYRGAVIKDGKELTSHQINSPNWRDYCVAGNEWHCRGEDFFNFLPPPAP